MSNFELLANELLLDLFEYLSTVHLPGAFLGLNSRFDTLIFVHLRTYYLDFRSVSKNDFEIICQRYLPTIIDRTASFHLSNSDDSNSQQLELFLSYGLILCQFTHLRSLSLYNVRSKWTMSMIIDDFHHLPHLKYLRLIKCHSLFGYMGHVHIFDTIWTLPKLTHFHLDTEQNNFHVPTVISSSLENVSIMGHCCHFSQLSRLFEKTPHLQSLHILLNYINNNDKHLQYPVQSITSLHLSNVYSKQVTTNLLQNMPNLNRLQIETHHVLLDGCQLEQIIDDYLPKLKVFRLKMDIEVHGKKKNEQQVNQLVDSFQSRFWIDKHQWYVRCHSTSQNNGGSFLLYTLPYTFEKFDMNQTSIFYKSTCPHDKNNGLYHQVHSLIYNSLLTTDLNLLHIRFCRIQHLSVTLPLDEQFWNIIPTLDQVTSLQVSGFDEDAPYHLQALLNRISHLRSLEIQSWPFSKGIFKVETGSMNMASSARRRSKKNSSRISQNQIIVSPLVQNLDSFSRIPFPEKQLFDR
jgi:hypothetical protein